LMKTCSRALRTSDQGEGSPSNSTTTLSTQTRQRRSGFGTSLWVAQPKAGLKPDWTSLERLEKSCAATELERIFREEWENLPKDRCAKLVTSYPRRYGAVITANGPSTKYWVKDLNTYVNVIFQFFIFYKLANIYKKCFLLCHFGYCVLIDEGIFFFNNISIYGKSQLVWILTEVNVFMIRLVPLTHILIGLPINC
jgi:hypothetical protein